MTTNQTIDGVLVSRELIERLTNPFGDPHDKFNAVQELRALLDADKVNNRQMGLVQFVEAHPIKPAAQPQGEPVKTPEMPYKMLPLEEDGWFQCVNAYEAMYPLYTEQPAPVAPEWPHLEKPAMVGAARFAVGVSTRLVVGAAQRLYEYEVTPDKEAQRIAKVAENIAALHAPVAVVLPERLQQVLKFLDGAENLGGHWFGEPHPSGRQYWWRNELRKAISETNLFAKQL